MITHAPPPDTALRVHTATVEVGSTLTDIATTKTILCCSQWPKYEGPQRHLNNAVEGLLRALLHLEVINSGGVIPLANMGRF